MRDTISTRISSLTAGRRISIWRASCVMFFQACSRCASPTSTTSGVPALSASTRPVTRLVAPGPERRIGEADAARDLGVGIGREDGGALVVDEMMGETEPARGVVERQELEAAHAEHGSALEGLDHAGERLAPGHLIGAHGSAFPRLPPRTMASAAPTIVVSETRATSSRLGA